MDSHKIRNRALFLAAVVFTGALAGAFVWAFFFLMNIGLNFIWKTLPEKTGFAFFPLVVCIVGASSSACTKSGSAPTPKTSIRS